MRPLRYQGRLPRRGLRLLDIVVKPTSTCYRLVSVVERQLGPRRRGRAAAYAKSKGATWAPRSREPWGWRSVERGEPRWRRWCAVERGGGSWWRFPGAGESWRQDAPESGEGWSVFFSARTEQSTLLIGGSGWRYGVPSSVSSPEPASGGFPRPESGDLERALPVSWASRLRCVKDLSLPGVARFLTGRHVACCLYGEQRKEGVWGKVAGWERRVKKLWRQMYCFGVPAASSGISVFQQIVRHGPRLRAALVMVAATPTTRIKKSTAT